MTQVTSLSVPNGTGSAVRQGFNNSISATATLNSGPSAPPTTWPYMLWADTTTGLVKLRNSANTAWITVAAGYPIGSSGGSVPLLSGTNTWSAMQTSSAEVGFRGQRSSQTTTPGEINYGGRLRSGIVGVIADFFIQSTVNGAVDAVITADNGSGQNAAWLFNPVSGNGFALKGAWTSGSDIRLKPDLEPISDALSKALTVRSGTYHDARDGQFRVSVVMDDIDAAIPGSASIIPEVTLADGSVIKDVKAGDWGAPVALLYAALQQMAGQVETLKAELAALKA
ncbi:hypothetical protein [Paenirhodobacter populi]|uniref:Peptidase S74 domain-containing protein n=1 Tax=Paenirhodobacter populi TaxID=2306993 RepID=A0A443JE55_9RHOB|nr:hypothetical protein [Sinirhodobacter populi]RWR18792.1 hypothetical protein D2T30_15635 [Sinirhodobacter populi]